jgi:TRAP-type transport system small permease protein
MPVLAALSRLVRIDVVLASASLLVMVGIALVNVFCRFVLNAPLLWGDEMVKLLFGWFCFTGMSVIAGRYQHLRIDLIDRILPERAALLNRLLGNAIVLLIGLILLVWGVSLAWSQLGNRFAAMPISRAWSFSALPVGALLMTLRLLPLIALDARRLRALPAG